MPQLGGGSLLRFDMIVVHQPRTSLAAEESVILSQKMPVKDDRAFLKSSTGGSFKHNKAVKPDDLYGEFVRMRDALDAANGVGGVKVRRAGTRKGHCKMPWL